MTSTANDIGAMYRYARQQMQETVRIWYPNAMIVDLEMTSGNPVARVCAWQATAARLAKNLTDWEGQFTTGPVANYGALLPAARLQVQQAVHEMWSGAFIATVPFGPHLSESEEFTQYRYGAQLLAWRLGMICAQALGIQLGGFGFGPGYTDPEHTVPGTLYGSNGGSMAPSDPYLKAPTNDPTNPRDPRDPNGHN